MGIGCMINCIVLESQHPAEVDILTKVPADWRTGPAGNNIERVMASNYLGVKIWLLTLEMRAAETLPLWRLHTNWVQAKCVRCRGYSSMMDLSGIKTRTDS
ncbi:hypothetical protein EJB05_45166, partial [Eragrostis curvula]